jgi:hypothetical protein
MVVVRERAKGMKGEVNAGQTSRALRLESELKAEGQALGPKAGLLEGRDGGRVA